MASTQASEKPMSEKQRLKLDNFANKKEKQAQQVQQQQPNGVSKEKKSKKQDVPAVESKDWVEETPAGQKKILKPLDDDFHKAYVPKVVESAWYNFWEDQGLFKPRTEKNGSLKSKGKYVIAIPPPNVTGKLHIGHALALSLEDTLIRWHRMRQFSTLYIPGCDHAGIATQAVVEKQLARHPKDGKSKRQDFSRPEFVQLCQDWKEDYHKEINKTTRRLGVSVDWSREAFTMNPQLSIAVTETFVQLHSEGLIYRANRLVHWSCRLSTALSTLEVDQKELEGTTKLDVPGYDKKIEFGTLTYFKYPIDGSDQTIEVATTRPETILGDTGIAVHPQDDRYKNFVGKTAQHPIIPDRKLRIIADEYVEREFGTGAVKLTPAHDHNDFNLGKKHNLPFINILNEDGILNSNAGHYAGEKRFNARYGVIEELKKLGLYTKQEPNKMLVPICSRSGDVIEPLLKPQWWMRMEPLTKPAIDVVESGELVIRPELQKRQYLQWMRNLQDWCLSRQLWWGHQIPAYYISIEGEDGGDDANDNYWVCGRTEREAQEKAEKKFPGKKVTLKRDEDVLDTWFSSALWPFSTLGWPDKTSDLENYFPNTTMETGWDILPFWVSRMIMFSLKLTGKVPFTEVFCHGLIRDSNGRKMSKSLGNVVDPIDILDGISLDGLHQKLLEGNLAQNEVKNAEKYQKKAFPQGIPEVGADALRFSLVNYTQASGSDINFDVKTMHGYRRFCNKIYQATKYVLGKLGDDFVPRESSALTGKESLPEKWILTKMNTAAKQINQALEEREFARSTQIIYRYLYDELFDIYIENSKSIISDGTPEEARSAMDTLYTTLESGLRLMSPFMPFLTEELWQRLPRRPNDNTSSITIAEYPEYESSFDDPRSKTAYELVLGCSKGIRSLIADYAVKDKGVAHIAPLNQMSHDTASAQLSAIESLSGKTPVDISILKAGEISPTGCAVFPVSADANVYLEVKDRIQDAGKEAEKVKAKLDEARKDQDDIDSLKAELSKVQGKDVTEAMQSAESRKRDVEARLRALEETVTIFEKMMISTSAAVSHGSDPVRHKRQITLMDTQAADLLEQDPSSTDALAQGLQTYIKHCESLILSLLNTHKAQQLFAPTAEGLAHTVTCVEDIYRVDVAAEALLPESHWESQSHLRHERLQELKVHTAGQSHDINQASAGRAVSSPRSCPIQSIDPRRLLLDPGPALPPTPSPSPESGGPSPVARKILQKDNKKSGRLAIRPVTRDRGGGRIGGTFREGKVSSHPPKPTDPLSFIISIPTTAVPSQHILHTLRLSCGSTGTANMEILIKLFYGIASPGAFFELRDVCLLSYTARELVPRDPDTNQNLQTLDRLSSIGCTTALLRRTYLAHLVELRNTRTSLHVEKSSSPFTRRRKRKTESDRYGRASSKAIDELMLEAYPKLNTDDVIYHKQRDSLKNRLARGRNWQMLQQSLSPRILCVVPRRGPMAVSDSQVEAIPVSQFEDFVKLLIKHRRRFLMDVSDKLTGKVLDVFSGLAQADRFLFEDTTADQLEAEAFESPALVAYCDKRPFILGHTDTG